ncbi:MAG: RsmB/NOP family class I SAM-dependent RNA methyltransferase [Victivallaceae bacterium]|nr:RsmB/NOP family class I SAM-dependent RNA methyltransferase [Victivallaceae bacterium]
MVVKNSLGAGKLRTQEAVCREIWRLVVAGVFAENRVADRTLAALLRQRKMLGSRDRRFISETIFSFFRYWGVLRMLAPDAAERLETDGEITFSELEISKLLLAAALLGNTPASLPEAAGMWASHLRIAMPVNWDFASVGRLFKAPDEWNNPSALLPEWMEKYIAPEIDRAGFYRTLSKRPPLWLRDQSGRTAAELAAAGVAAIPHPRRPEMLAVPDGRINLYTLESFRRGDFEIQDAASQLIGLVCSPAAGERWWDCCAGAGGKSLQLASLMGRKGTVVATDVRGYKLEDLRRRARRAGFPNIVTREWDGKKPRVKDQMKFDGVLVDAPCSCSGTFRRNPDGRWMLKEDELAELSALQLSILENAASGVKPGGVLVYATCSMFKKENGEVVEKFLAGAPDFALEPFVNPVTGRSENGMVQANPEDADSDAMFACRMRRRGNPRP